MRLHLPTYHRARPSLSHNPPARPPPPHPRPPTPPFPPNPPGTTTARSSRDLQQLKGVAKLDLPSIQEFLPAGDVAGVVNVNKILKNAGLPSWEELGLPPISELMKPVGAPRSVMDKMPTKADVAKMANATLVQVVNELLPPELKALASVQLPKLKMSKVLPMLKLPQMPAKLPPLADLLKSLPPIDPKAQLSIPGVPGAKLPPAGELIKFLEAASKYINAMPHPQNMPTLAEILKVINSVSSSVNGVVGQQKAG
jgi:hypothetical protein